MYSGEGKGKFQKVQPDGNQPGISSVRKHSNMARWTVGGVVGLTFTIFSTAILLEGRSDQTGDGPKPTGLQLRLKPGELRSGVPQVFTFQIVNVSDHEIRVASPAIECEDSFDGSLYLEFHFTPLEPGASAGEGGGCAGDRFGEWPSILERIRTWKTLQPGDSLTFKADRAHLFYNDETPGRYEFWASYQPPFIENIDQQLLRGSGIDFPSTRLTSQHLVFRKNPE